MKGICYLQACTEIVAMTKNYVLIDYIVFICLFFCHTIKFIQNEINAVLMLKRVK